MRTASATACRRGPLAVESRRPRRSFSRAVVTRTCRALPGARPIRLRQTHLLPRQRCLSRRPLPFRQSRLRWPRIPRPSAAKETYRPRHLRCRQGPALFRMPSQSPWLPASLPIAHLASFPQSIRRCAVKFVPGERPARPCGERAFRSTHQELVPCSAASSSTSSPAGEALPSASKRPSAAPSTSPSTTAPRRSPSTPPTTRTPATSPPTSGRCSPKPSSRADTSTCCGRAPTARTTPWRRPASRATPASAAWRGWWWTGPVASNPPSSSSRTFQSSPPGGHSPTPAHRTRLAPARRSTTGAVRSSSSATSSTSASSTPHASGPRRSAGGSSSWRAVMGGPSPGPRPRTGRG